MLQRNCEKRGDGSSLVLRRCRAIFFISEFITRHPPCKCIPPFLCVGATISSAEFSGEWCVFTFNDHIVPTDRIPFLLIRVSHDYLHQNSSLYKFHGFVHDYGKLLMMQSNKFQYFSFFIRRTMLWRKLMSNLYGIIRGGGDEKIIEADSVYEEFS